MPPTFVTRKAVLQSLCTLPVVASSAAVPSSGGAVNFRYLGTAGWEISDHTTIILVDPYVSRINGPPPPGLPPYKGLGDSRRVYGWDDVPTPDTVAVDAHISRATLIAVTHAHYDHILDVPDIALKTQALVIGHESTQNILRGYNVPEQQLLTVRGGEDYDFGLFSIKLIPSIRSALDHKHYYSSAQAPAGLHAPLTLRQMHPEGGTLAFLIRLSGHEILVFGSMNYIEREIEGLEPDVVIAGAGSSRKEIYEYSGRLMRSLRFPKLVLPTHWDNFLAPFAVSQQPQITALQSFVREIKAASPDTMVPLPQYFATVRLG